MMRQERNKQGILVLARVGLRKPLPDDFCILCKKTNFELKKLEVAAV
jgi:hypothetical protein